MSETEMAETEFSVMWHSEFDGFFTTEINANEKPSVSEAAQIVAVKEDIDVCNITVDVISIN